jgi:hypothetical protein
MGGMIPSMLLHALEYWVEATDTREAAIPAMSMSQFSSWTTNMTSSLTNSKSEEVMLFYFWLKRK